MIGLEGISIDLGGREREGLRSRSVRCGTDAADDRQENYGPFGEFPDSQPVGCVTESDKPYGSSTTSISPHPDDPAAIDKGISRIGVWISYLENKYDLA